MSDLVSRLRDGERRARRGARPSPRSGSRRARPGTALRRARSGEAPRRHRTTRAAVAAAGRRALVRGTEHRLSRPGTFLPTYEMASAWLDGLPEVIGVPIERTIIGGFSQGSVMSYALGLGQGRPAPAGIIALSGFVPTVDGFELDLEGRSGFPVAIGHGTARPSHRRRVGARGPRTTRGRRRGGDLPRVPDGPHHRPSVPARAPGLGQGPYRARAGIDRPET